MGFSTLRGRGSLLPSHGRAYPWIALGAGLIFLARVAAAMWTFNHTIDEPYHLGSAVVLYEAGREVVGVQHPPLARLVAGLPLWIQGVRWPAARDAPGYRSPVVEYAGFPIGNEILASGQLPYWRMLLSARLALLIFPAAALFYVYRLGRWLASPRAAMLATVFVSLDPTLLGHSIWIGTDLAGCAGFVAGMYYGLRWLARPSLRRGAVFGIAVGLAIGSKYNCALLLPGLALVAAARVVLARRPVRKIRRLPGIGSLALACALAFLVLWATFLFDVGAMRFQALFPPGTKSWERLPPGLTETPIPMPEFFLGYLYLATRADTGHATYLNGQISFTGWWAYFPEALVVKETLGFLIALALAIAVVLIARPRRALLAVALLSPAGLYFGVAMASKYQLGIRHLLPILPLLYVWIAIVLARGRRRSIALLAIMALAAIETAIVHPDYLSFFNLAAGGARHGDRYLIDSNLDWGQDLWRLSQWMRTSPQARGRTIAIRAFNDHQPPLSQLGIDPALTTGALEPRRGLLAISKNVEHRLEGATVQPDGTMHLGPDYSWLGAYPVIARVGDSIDVYDLDKPTTTTTTTTTTNH